MRQVQGGRISIEIHKKYNQLNITGFDFVDGMIKSALSKECAITFLVQDASDLTSYNDETFDYAIYLQQLLSLIPFSIMPKVLDESYRILSKDGLIIFSVLDFKGRWFNPILSFLVNSARLLRGEKLQRKTLPWLKIGNKFNWFFLGKGQATTYWFTKDEIESLVTSTGYQIIESISGKEILNNDSVSGLYLVCKKKHVKYDD